MLSISMCWVWFEYVLSMFWVCFEYVWSMGVWFEYGLSMFWVCFEYVLNMFWVCFEYVLNWPTSRLPHARAKLDAKRHPKQMPATTNTRGPTQTHLVAPGENKEGPRWSRGAHIKTRAAHGHPLRSLKCPLFFEAVREYMFSWAGFREYGFEYGLEYGFEYPPPKSPNAQNSKFSKK